MAQFSGGRPSFRDWVDRQPDPAWDALPLTHVTKALVAQDIITEGAIRPKLDAVFDEPVAYFFYGRPAYRVSGDGTIKVVAACPFCFVFDSKLAETASAIHAFDTGAFQKRMYSTILMQEMQIEDFGLGNDYRRANRLISSVYGTKEAYLKGDISNLNRIVCDPWEFHVRAYLDLITSPGRNEPDDRVSTIEFVFNRDVPIVGGVKGVIVPHILWDSKIKTPWLQDLSSSGVEIATYEFVPGKAPDYYYAHLELQVRDLYRKWSVS